MSENMVKVYGVSELTVAIRRLLEGGFATIWVRGELSEFNAHSASGHVYMTLKDKEAQIRAVFFRGARNCVALGLAVGSEVEVQGRLTVYAPQGSYQIQVDYIRPVGMGGLRQQFEAMRARLQAEGLFAPERKRPIPAFPRCVGVITSRDGAALQDFLNVLARRHSGLHVRIFPTLVQGHDAAMRIASAIAYVNKYSLCDVIVVTRGGGSLEDLWAFNEEPVARAIAASSIPVISAVGHERDFTICDYVADFRCATPSVAAEQVIKAKRELLERVSNAYRRLRDLICFRLSEARRRYEALSGSVCMRRPQDILNTRRQQLDMLTQRLGQTLPRRAELASQRLTAARQRLGAALPRLSERSHVRLDALVRRLEVAGTSLTQRFRRRLERASGVLLALGPRNVLNRGYSVLLTEEGHAVRDSSEVTGGQRLHALLGKGEIDVNVSSNSKEE